MEGSNWCFSRFFTVDVMSPDLSTDQIPHGIIYKIIKKWFESNPNLGKSGIWFESPSPKSWFGLSPNIHEDTGGMRGDRKKDGKVMKQKTLSHWRVIIILLFIHEWMNETLPHVHRHIHEDTGGMRGESLGLVMKQKTLSYWRVIIVILFIGYSRLWGLLLCGTVSWLLADSVNEQQSK